MNKIVPNEDYGSLKKPRSSFGTATELQHNASIQKDQIKKVTAKEQENQRASTIQHQEDANETIKFQNENSNQSMIIDDFQLNKKVTKLEDRENNMTDS